MNKITEIFLKGSISVSLILFVFTNQLYWSMAIGIVGVWFIISLAISIDKGIEPFYKSLRGD